MESMPAAAFLYKRIVVVGVTGCGKSTLAEKLGQKLSLEFIELDALFWKPGWVESDRDEFKERVKAAVCAPAWALAGNYSQLRDLIWPRAEAVIWLDYPFLLVFRRLWNRTWQRYRTKEVLWGSNYERVWPQFKIWSKESLFHWQVRSYGKHKRLYPRLFADPENAHLKVFHFKSPAETEDWLDSLIKPEMN
jgi:adenylate kinase family enzyme